MKKTVILLMLVVSSAVIAQNKVVVIPMGGDAEPLQNVITVSRKNGDFTGPVAAMASITDSDENNRYLVVIGPGVYTLAETLVMKEYVDIIGSGRNATELTGTIGGNMVEGASNASLSSLSINAPGAGPEATVINNNSASPALSDLNISIDRGNAGNLNFGVYNRNSSTTMSSLNITMTGEHSGNHGIWSMNESSVTIANVNLIMVPNGANFCLNVEGPDTFDPGLPVSSARIYNSEITGCEDGTINGSWVPGFGGSTYISDTIVEGAVTRARCSFVFLSDGTPLDDNCKPPSP